MATIIQLQSAYRIISIGSASKSKVLHEGASETIVSRPGLNKPASSPEIFNTIGDTKHRRFD
jgi:hypothetical protein